jgi:hypothetical protein
MSERIAWLACTDKVIQALRPLSILLLNSAELKDLPTQKRKDTAVAPARRPCTEPDLIWVPFRSFKKKGKQYSVHHRLHLVVFRSYGRTSSSAIVEREVRWGLHFICIVHTAIRRHVIRGRSKSGTGFLLYSTPVVLVVKVSWYIITRLATVHSKRRVL